MTVCHALSLLVQGSVTDTTPCQARQRRQRPGPGPRALVKNLDREIYTCFEQLYSAKTDSLQEMLPKPFGYRTIASGYLDHLSLSLPVRLEAWPSTWFKVGNLKPAGPDLDPPPHSRAQINLNKAIKDFSN